MAIQRDEKDEESVVLNRFDDIIFEDKSKPRKTKNQKRVAKALYNRKRTQTIAPEKDDDDTKQKEEMPNTTDPESTSSLENRNQENHAKRTATTLNMDKEEFQKLQENDSTLEPIQKLVREGTTMENRAKFFKRKGLIYRQWRPNDNHEDDSGSVEQPVIPRKCRKWL